MKVLQINSFFSVGGPPRIMNGIYTTLTENGHDCRIAAAREKMLFPENSIMIGNSKGTYINAIESRIFDNDGFLATKSTKELVKRIDEYNPDIIQIHNLHGYYIDAEILFNYLKGCGKPVIWTLHDCWSMTGHCPHFSIVHCDRYIDGCYQCPQKTEYPSSYIFDRAQRNWIRKKEAFTNVPHMTIVTPSKWLANIVGTSYLKSYPVKVIHNGIDLKDFSYCPGQIRKDYSLENKRIVLGVAQNWAEHKGFEDFIRLSEMLGEDYQVVMIGLTDNQMKAIPRRILGLKRTNSIDELVQWYSNTHVFVNLTYQDTFPTVNIEALACGTPVITYNTGGSPEAIDESCGWVVEQGNVEKVASIIQSMGDNRQYQDKAIARSKAFDRKTKYMEYIELYQDMLNKAEGNE